MTENDRVVLSVPARGEFARMIRLASAELAVRAGMNIDDVDDVKLAVEEAFVYACERVSLGELVFSFTLAEGSVELLLGPLPGICDDDNGAAEAGDRYARFILESVCDEYELVERDGSCFVRLVKRAG
ncbi:MAG: ATP-binding protein [Coriobacteriia bacterium]|nr:ATP-binding protein [Coriobacteriia bacterium]